MPLLPVAAIVPLHGKLAFGYQRSSDHIHRGIDLVAREGAPVYAAAAGVVEHASVAWEPGFTDYGGHVVILHHDGNRTLYAHLSRVLVRRGQRVVQGQFVGAVGRTQYSAPDHTSLLEGAHLHFEVSPTPYPQDSEAPRLDPVAWLHGFPWGRTIVIAAILGVATWWYVHKRTVLR